MKIRIFIILALIILIHSLHAQRVVINEVMSSNTSTIADEDGEFPDWIELYNPSDTLINLLDHGLSDDRNAPLKWSFPEVTLYPGQFLVVYASDKDRRVWDNLFWETIINQGDQWKYRIGDSEPPENWYSAGFDDSAWLSGPSGFGNSDNDDATVVPEVMSVAIRKTFRIGDTTHIAAAVLHVDYDDAFVAYLNGVEIARANIGQPGIPPAYDQDADNWHEARIYTGGAPEEFPLEEFKTLLHQGDNVLAIQVNNFEKPDSDLTLIPFFTLGLDVPPENPLGAPDILPLRESFLHANFKIQSEGESLFLSDPDRLPLDTVRTVSMPTDISWGRQPDGQPDWMFFDTPTPGQPNDTEGFTGTAELPLFSPPAGFYNSPVELNLSAGSPDAVIYFTRDGSEPGEDSEIFSETVLLENTTVIRAKVLESGKLPGKTATGTYLINAGHTVPVISLSTTPANLWDYNTGIYTMGPNASSSDPYFGANFWMDWERPVHVEMFEPDGSPAFSQDAGLKIHGGWPKAYAQKSVALFARTEYGPGEIAYPIFPDKPIDTFESVILRNAGNDWKYTLFRDGMIQGLLTGCNLDLQAYRPAVVYLNGEYWGIHNIREKINEHYIASNYNIDAGSIDLMEINLDNPAAFALQGDAESYESLIRFVEQNDLSNPANYAFAASQIDVDSYLDYHVAQIYMDNKDWPGNNNKFWRPRREGGKWRWIVFDLDYGFGLYNSSAYASNTLEWATDPDGEGGDDSHNLPFTTFLFRNMLNNEGFRNAFINRFADYLNTIFLPAVVLEKIDAFKSAIEPEMQRHYEKWGNGNFAWGSSMGWSYFGRWDTNINRMITFSKLRPANMRTFIADHFGLSGTAEVTLNSMPAEAGKIKINSVIQVEASWKGHYFRDVPIQLIALPANGYRFVRWEGIEPSNAPAITVTLTENISASAVFEPHGSSTGQVIINEINYNPAPDFDTEDWIELYNFSASAMDLSGWQFKDSNDDNIFIIPENTILEADDFLVLCHDTTDFKSLFPGVSGMGNFGFNLSNGGDMVRLYTAEGALVDSLVYDDVSPWPVLADGLGPTLELKNPALDNTLAESWQASSGHGTPGAVNGSFVSVDQGAGPMPEEFFVADNYPDPFNGVTWFAFRLPERSRVEITIYNVVGQLIETLVDTDMQPGYHVVPWDAGDQNSGVYFYRIKAGVFSAHGKCVLIR